MHHQGLFIEVMAHVKRERDLEAFERLQRLGALSLPARGGGLRAWMAARLVALGLHLDRRAGERAVARAEGWQPT